MQDPAYEEVRGLEGMEGGGRIWKGWQACDPEQTGAPEPQRRGGIGKVSSLNISLRPSHFGHQREFSEPEYGPFYYDGAPECGWH